MPPENAVYLLVLRQRGQRTAQFQWPIAGACQNLKNKYSQYISCSKALQSSLNVG